MAAEWVIAGELGELRQSIEHMMLNAGEREKKTRSSMARLEADFIRRFMEFGKLGRSEKDKAAARKRLAEKVRAKERRKMRPPDEAGMCGSVWECSAWRAGPWPFRR